MAGNKGAVAIRMDYADTRMCFVTAHLAAGFANYGDRNRDYNTISSGLRFQRNCSIEDHDVVIWLGDFNYRIGLADEVVRKLVANGDIETLYDNDQVLSQQPLVLGCGQLMAAAQSSDGGRSHLPVLLRGSNNLHANLPL